MKKYYTYDSYISVQTNDNGGIQVIDSTWKEDIILTDNLEMDVATSMAEKIWREKYTSGYMYDDIGHEYYIDENGVVHWTEMEG